MAIKALAYILLPLLSSAPSRLSMPFFRSTTRMMMRPTMVSAMRATPKKLGGEPPRPIPKGKTYQGVLVHAFDREASPQSAPLGA
jgi:hypothetical protein